MRLRLFFTVFHPVILSRTSLLIPKFVFNPKPKLSWHAKLYLVCLIAEALKLPSSNRFHFGLILKSANIMCCQTTHFTTSKQFSGILIRCLATNLQQTFGCT